MQPVINFSKRRNEHGVTIVLVAVAMVVLLGMAALAIDVVTLYVARAEAQRAADAAALAGARMFVSTGFTSGQLGLVTNSTAQGLACVTGAGGGSGAVNQEAEAVAGRNLIAGQPAVILSVNCNFSHAEDPQVTVTVQRTGLPTFFAKVWGNTGNAVTAAATAEAFNPSGSSVPIKVAFVKPWLIPNCDPNVPFPCAPSYLVDPTASYALNNSANYIGQVFTFKQRAPDGSGAPATPWYYAIDPPALPPLGSPAVCPATSAVSCGSVRSGNDYQDNIACNHTFEFACGQTIGPGGIPWIPLDAQGSGTLGPITQAGTQCLIHMDGGGGGQDTITPSPVGTAVSIGGGYNNPNPLLRVPNISRSDSVVSVPIYDGSNLCSLGGGCTTTTQIIGFLQLGIQNVAANGDLTAVIINAAGCDPNATGTIVSGGGLSPIPVRLIHQ